MDQVEPIDWGNEGLRETFLAAYPAQARKLLRQLIRDQHSYCERFTDILYADPEMGSREDAELAGLAKDVRHVRQVAESLERRVVGPQREGIARLRSLLWEAETLAAELAPETRDGSRRG